MEMQGYSHNPDGHARELIDNAAHLPVEAQAQLLEIARGMAFTKRCLQRESATVKPYGNADSKIPPRGARERYTSI